MTSAPDPSALVPLVAFDPATAHAVVAVLRRQGIRAQADDGDAEQLVRVPAHRRDTALRVLATHMEDVRAALDRAPAPPPSDRGSADPAAVRDDDAGRGPPLVMERFRSLGLLVVIGLAPLLIVTLASVPIPRAVAITIVVAAAALIVALILRRR